MATVRAFRALRPVPTVASRVAAVPYDVVDTDEARLLASDSLSFLHVSRAEPMSCTARPVNAIGC